MFKLSKSLISLNKTFNFITPSLNYNKFTPSLISITTKQFCNQNKNNKSFMDRIKKRLNLSKEEKIDADNLKPIDDSNDYLNSSKIDDGMIELPDSLGNLITDDVKNKIMSELDNNNLMDNLNDNLNDNNNYNDNDITHSHIGQIFIEEKKDEDKLSTIENLKRRFGIQINEFFHEKQEDYNQLSYVSDILPRIEKLNKFGYKDLHIKVILHKMYPNYIYITYISHI